MNSFIIEKIEKTNQGYTVRLKNCEKFGIFVSKTNYYVENWNLPAMSDQTSELIREFAYFMNNMTLHQRVNYLENLIQPLESINKFNL